MIQLAANRSASRQGTSAFPGADEHWDVLLRDSKLVNERSFASPIAIPDASQFYYVPPLSKPDPEHPRPLIIQNPILWNNQGAAVAFDNGTSEFLSGDQLWSAVHGLSVVPDRWRYPPPGEITRAFVITRPSR